MDAGTTAVGVFKFRVSPEFGGTPFWGQKLVVSENVVYPKKPNGFADHYPYEKWLFHWED